MMNRESILILDLGSPYTQLIAQRIRDNHVFSRIVPYDISAKEIALQKPKGIILSGGPTVPTKSKRIPLPDKKIFKLNIPILGIGYGLKVIVQFFGGRVKSSSMPGFQICELFIDDTSNLFLRMPSNITCWMSYEEYITNIPKGFKKTAHTQDNPVTAIESANKKVFGVSFHPEVVATQRGNQILSNFLYRICGCIGNWTMNSFIRETSHSIKKAVGKSRVIVNLTTTLESFVVALLVNRVIGNRLKCVFIDDGLLRKDEAKQIKNVISGYFHLNLDYLDKKPQFLKILKGITKPEEKVKAVTNLYNKIFQEKAAKVKGTEFIACGTLYSDVGKTGFNHKALKLKVLQPLTELFREELKAVAKELGLPDNIIFRQPFPETGFVRRIAGEVTLQRLKVIREAQEYLVEEIKSAELYEQVWQSFAVLLPGKNVIAIRCVASTDGTAANWVRLPYEVLENISKRIISRMKGISRVVYDISSRPPSTIEWE